MNLRQYILIFSFGTMLAIASFVIVVLNIDLITSGTPALIIFYVTLFAALMGIFTTVGTIIRAYRFKKRDLEDIVITSLRQSFMLTVLLEGSLVLLSVEKLTWWSAPIIIFVIAILEFVALSRKHGKKQVL